MSNHLLSRVNVEAAQACTALDPAVLAHLSTVASRAVRRAFPADDRLAIHRDDVAQVATMYAALLTERDGYDPTAAALAAARTCAEDMRRDALGRDDKSDDASAQINTAGSLDEIDEDGQPRVRLGAATTATDAQYRTTTADRIVRAAQALDPRTATIAAACHSAEWKGGKVPAAAIRRALDLPPVTGRAGTAWSAQMRDEAPAAVEALHDEYRALLTEDAQGVESWQPCHYGSPRTRRPVAQDYDEAAAAQDAPRAYPAVPARLVLVPAEGPAPAVTVERLPALVRLPDALTVERGESWQYGDRGATAVRVVARAQYAQPEGPAALVTVEGTRPSAYVSEAQAHDTGRTTTDPRKQDRPRTSGPASPVARWTVVAGYPISLDTGALLSHDERTRPRTDTTLPAHRAGSEAKERQAFDAMATDAQTTTAGRIPGVSVDEDGNALAGSGVANRGSSTAPAAQKRPASRKSARTGGTGPTIPAGPRR